MEDYYSVAYGENWRAFRDYLHKLYQALPFDFFSRDEASLTPNVHFDPQRAEKIASIPAITREGRALIESNYPSEYRIQTASMRILRMHADFCDRISDWMAAKARGELEEAEKLYNTARVETGKFEAEIEEYFDHNLYFTEYYWTQQQKSPSKEDILSI